MKRIALVALLVCVLSACAVLGLCHGDAITQDRDAIAVPASLHHWAGTDDLGRDRAARVALAMLLGLGGAVAVAAVSTTISIAVALAAVFTRPIVAGSVLYVSDGLLTLPSLFLLMLVRSALPLELPATVCAATTMLLLAMLGWPMYVRGLCARTAATRDADWLLYARASGLSTGRVLLRWVVPQLRPLYLTQFLICVPAVILAEADLGAIGFGMSEPLVSWGTLLKELGSASQIAATHWAYLPMALLLLMLLCFEMLSAEN